MTTQGNRRLGHFFPSLSLYEAIVSLFFCFPRLHQSRSLMDLAEPQRVLWEVLCFWLKKFAHEKGIKQEVWGLFMSLDKQWQSAFSFGVEKYCKTTLNLPHDLSAQTYGLLKHDLPHVFTSQGLMAGPPEIFHWTQLKKVLKKCYEVQAPGNQSVFELHGFLGMKSSGWFLKNVFFMQWAPKENPLPCIDSLNLLSKNLCK